MIVHAVPARVGILGNPSDGYGGRTLALAVARFEATVSLEPADGVEIVSLGPDEPSWPSLPAMTEHLDRHGYGTGPQLLAATIRTFVDVADSIDVPLRGGFRLRYETTIPRQVGLGGSSALVIATLRCLCQHYGVSVPETILPSLALQVETAQLGISAGLQDRVVQTFGGLVAMDFGHEVIDSRFGVTHGIYEREDPSALPPLFVAYQARAAHPSDLYHQRLRARYEAGDPYVREVLRELASLVVEGRAALRWRDHPHFVALIGRNMDLRRDLGPIPETELDLVEVAESFGSHATFAGSRGAVVGNFDDDAHLARLTEACAELGAEVVRVDGSDAPTADPGTVEDEVEEADVVALEQRRR
jgi:glucuronokinase